MNIRSLTRGDGVVIGAAVLLFIASFLDYYSAEVDLPSAWDTDYYGLALPTIFLAGFAAAGLIVASRFLPEGRKLAGIPLAGWGTVLAVASAWAAVWALLLAPDRVDLGPGSIISFLATWGMAFGALAGPKIAALNAPLVTAPAPGAHPQYGAQPGPLGQPGAGYGYPGGQQQQYGSTPQPVPPYGGQDHHAPAPAPVPNPQDAQPMPEPAPVPAADFTPFWFAVPVARPLFAEDGSPNPIAELAPGTWYLAVEQRGAALVAQTQDNRRGVLNDTSGIQRG